MTSPLSSLRIIEFAGLGPTPFTAMMLADMGADILRIERPTTHNKPLVDNSLNYLNRGRPSVILDLRSPEGVSLARDLCMKADVLIEGFRPGAMERLGLGPEDLQKDNPGLIYARTTGWGQAGPLADKAGHDINYLSLTGALNLMGPPDRPPHPPLNIMGNFGGGGMFAVTGILAALIERTHSGLGQVVDTAMLDGASVLLTQIFAWKNMGFWNSCRGRNLLDGGAYFYRCYETHDGKYMAVGALEQEFHDALVQALGFQLSDFGDYMNQALWPERQTLFAKAFLTKTRDEWCDSLADHDVCVTPVLSLDEAVTHPANIARKVHQIGPLHHPYPAPAPRLSRTPAKAGAPSGPAGEGSVDSLTQWGIDHAVISNLMTKKILQGR